MKDVELQNVQQAAQIAMLSEQVRQRDVAIQQIQASLMFRTMLKLRSAATKVGMQHVLKAMRAVKHRKNVPAQPVAPVEVPQQQKEFDYDHVLTGTEARFYAYKQARVRNYPALLSQMHSPCVKDMVSVILPVYNGDDMVALSIESVLNQTYRNFEFIIMDDGSFDRTPEIVDAYAAKDSRIRVVHQKNQKLPRTLSNGFALARGEFLTWTSADNIMHPDFLEKLVGEMKNHPETGMIYANLDLIDENGDPLTDMHWYPDPLSPEVVRLPQSVLELNIYPDNYIAAAFMYRASVAHAIGNYSANRYTTEDYDYWMRINDCFNLRHTSFDDPIYSYRFHSKSLTAQDKQLKISANRYRLMLWDEFRRGFLMRPLCWSFSGLDKTDYCQQQFLQALKAAGHTVIESEEDRAGLCENHYTTVVYVAFDGEKANADNLPKNCYKVCVCDKPTQVSEKWDCLVSRTPVTAEDFLCNHRGWFSFENEQAMFVYLDVQAKNALLDRMETVVETAPQYEVALSVVFSYQGNLTRLRTSLFSLLESDSNDAYEIVVVGPQECRDEVERLFQSLKQDDLEQKVILRFAGANSVNQAECANVGLWASKGRYVVFADEMVSFEDGFVNHAMAAARLYPEAACISGEIVADRSALPAVKEFSAVQSIAGYYPTGCVMFQTHELMLVGGISVFEDAEGCSVPSGWELVAMGRLMQYGRQMAHTNALCQILQGVRSETMQTMAARLKNQFMLQIEGIVPFETWPEGVAQTVNQLDQKVLLDYQAGANVLQTTHLKQAYEQLLASVREYFRMRCDRENARALYTRHWADMDGTMKDENRLEWLAQNMEHINTPWISIVVPVYKVEKYLARCVDSLLAQTLEQIEVILVDDGSPDQCPALCDEYAKKDVRVRVVHKKNGGLSDARNAGIEIANGEYLGFVDSDDWVEPDMFEKLLFAARLSDAQIAEASFDSVYKTHTDPETDATGTWAIGDRVYACACQLDWKYFKCVAWNKIYHKSIFADGKRYPVGKYHEDEFFTTKAFYSCARLVSIDDTLYHYDRTREDSITGEQFSVKGLDVVEALRERCAFFKEKNEQMLYFRTADMYCWTALDRLERCKQAHITGERVDQIVKWLKEDRPEMERIGINHEKIAAVEQL